MCYSTAGDVWCERRPFYTLTVPEVESLFAIVFFFLSSLGRFLSAVAAV